MIKTKANTKIHEFSEISGADCLLRVCGNIQSNERVLIVCDPSTRQVAQVVEQRARFITQAVSVCEIPELRMHGEEPPAQVGKAMLEADICLGLTAKSICHTQARLKAAAKGCRYLSLPDYSLDVLRSPSLHADYAKQAEAAKKIADRFTAGDRIHVTSRSGTDIRLSIRGRKGNCCPGYVRNAGDLGSPPDIESNVSPLETESEGIVIVDGSIPYPGLGVLKSPVTLRVKAGLIYKMEGEPVVLRKLDALFQMPKSKKAYVLAECGVGLNDLATLSGVMLTDEGALGTMHFGFGSNATVGGVNAVPFHLDFVFCNPTLQVNEKPILKDGELCL